MGLAGPVSAQLPLCATSRPTNVEGVQLHLFVLGSTVLAQGALFTDEISNASMLLAYRSVPRAKGGTCMASFPRPFSSSTASPCRT